MSDLFVEPPTAAMSDAAFRRRREHLFAELNRPASRSRRPVLLVVAAIALGLLASAPVGGASLAHRAMTGLGDLWSSAAPPPDDPADVQNLAEDVTRVPPGVANRAGTPLLGKARDLLSGLGTAGETISAFPTSTGDVCYEIKAAGSCGNLDKWPWKTVGFTFGILWTRADGARVYGVAADQVASINIVIAGTPHPAILQNNAFYYQLPRDDHSEDVQRVVAVWDDGSTHVFHVHDGRSGPD
jgi:hypothetical protein